jgi:hypothetical protein
VPEIVAAGIHVDAIRQKRKGVIRKDEKHRRQALVARFMGAATIAIFRGRCAIFLVENPFSALQCHAASVSTQS